jgi:hypothetical protein
MIHESIISPIFSVSSFAVSFIRFSDVKLGIIMNLFHLKLEIFVIIYKQILTLQP